MPRIDAPPRQRQWAVAALGAVLAAASVAHFLLHDDYEHPVRVAAMIIPTLGVFGYGLWFWLLASSVPRGDAVAVWAVGGAGLVLALDLWAVLAGAYGAITVQHVVIQHASFGALGGAVAGTYAERDRWRGRSRARLMAALDSAMDGIAMIDDAEQTVQYANASFTGGTDAERVRGQSWQSLYPSESHGPIADALVALDDGDQQQWQGIVTACGADGTTYPQELTMTAVADGYVWVCRDVTDRRDHSQRLRVLRRVLRHDTRNALNVVLGRADRIESRLGDEDDAAGQATHEPDLAAIQDAATGLLETSEKSRALADALARGDAGTESVADIVRTEATAVRDGHAETAVVVTVEADAAVDERLRLGIRELLSNAAEHAPTDAARVEVSVTGNPLAVRVHDNGPGIPEAEQRVLSGQAETPLKHSSGVGLWVVYWIVRQTGGTVSVDDGDIVITPATQ
ncbi:PAS domain-containing sensor histidine kinase [Halobacterium salinarum]|nr:PAS domain-containing sensor histidine kinase [Halobacterium salinarum]MCF2165106.1 PAS domain-containing sensor histidine kinase [Halobacterium salinarum]MCF2168085.1 PAS domain-containing sensor histidine kinase [Halobacterium salinarum]MCF2238289.1 PAS domain-containing sensor histidine kinase [Halobacterium salinarum]